MPDIGRMGGYDKLADDVMQVDLTPYNYSWNNPTNLNDPDGNCPQCWGFVVGVVVDYGLQVAENYAKGKTGSDAWTDVNYKSMAISGIAGAGTGGLSTLKHLGTGTKTVLSLTIDVAEESSKQYVDQGKVDGVQLTTNVLVGKALDTKITKEISSSKISTAERKLDRAERVNRSDKPSRQEAVNTAKKELTDLNTNNSKRKAANSAADKTVDGVSGNAATNMINGSTSQGGKKKFQVVDERTTVRDNTRVNMPSIRFF